MEVVLGALFIFLLRLASVLLSTVRTLMMMRGRKTLVTLLAFPEVLIYIIAAGKVVQNLGNLWNLFGYCGGVAAGTWVGMVIEEKLALGFAMVRIVSIGKGGEIASAIRNEGYGATEMRGQGRNNMVDIINVVVKRKDVPSVLAIATGVDEKAFVTVEEPKSIYRGYLPVAK
ncbi:MAG: DUF5698 domain-containing protein [Chloroflexota bacterium]|nr:DUF5698 domain-containing protein [Chloroflexota bacterium]